MKKKKLLNVSKIMNEIKIRANYSFWKHPFKWIKERKLRRVMQDLINFEMTDDILYGTNWR